MLTLDKNASFEETIKKSRFIGHAARVTSQAESLGFYESVIDPQATHNCWAWRINFKVRSSDDGEPSGTAGRPMLNVIERRDLENVMVVVTRYFGGIKLGTGGLVKVYRFCFRKLPVITSNQLDGCILTDIISLLLLVIVNKELS